MHHLADASRLISLTPCGAASMPAPKWTSEHLAGLARHRSNNNHMSNVKLLSEMKTDTEFVKDPFIQGMSYAAINNKLQHDFWPPAEVRVPDRIRAPAPSPPPPCTGRQHPHRKQTNSLELPANRPLSRS